MRDFIEAAVIRIDSRSDYRTALKNHGAVRGSGVCCHEAQ